MGRALRIRRLLGVCLTLGVASAAAASEYHGRVFFGELPVPGATVTATQGSKHFSAITDLQGLFSFADLPNGVWKIHVAMKGFAAADGQTTVAPKTASEEWKLQLLNTEQMALLAKNDTTPTRTQSPASAPASDDSAIAATSEDQAADGLVINGSENNAATSRYATRAAFGNRRPGVKSLYTGSLGARVSNSVFDARPYSLTGLDVPKASYSRVTSLFTLGGPLNIPPVMYHGPTFFIAYRWARNREADSEQGLVPDAAERAGDLSGLLDSLGQPLSIYDPATGLPFAGPVPVSPQANALLALYPLPNLAGSSRYNYQTQVLNNTHTDVLQSRLDKSLGRRDQLSGGFGFQDIRSDTANLFQFRDATGSLGMDAKVNWSHEFNHNILLNLGYHFTRLRTQLTPEFASRENISSNAGILGNSQAPSDWGPPQLIFSSGIAALSDANSSFNRNRTDALSIGTTWSRGTQTIKFGGDFRRQEYNQFGQQNPRGQFAFTGVATQAPAASATENSGSDFADFLLGIPDTSSLAFGNPDKYFRQSVSDVFANDDWRIRPELTLDIGMRWDYGAPMTELFGRLVNLDIAPGFAAASPVLGTSPKGPVTGANYPSSLIRPDRLGFEPRIGLSWRPLPASTLVVRAGYGIYDDTSIYLASVESMAQQAPLSQSLNVANSAACALTLANGFRNCAGTTSQSFAADPNLRVGYAQIWQLAVQKDLPDSLVLSATYRGIKGTRGMQQFLPNTDPIGAADLCPSCPRGFVFATSGGNSTREEATFQLRRRLRSGLTATLQYTYSKSLDNNAALGGQGHMTSEEQTENTPAPMPTIAQNWLDLHGERGLSVFDQRHMLKAQAQYTSGMGLGGGGLLDGWRGTLLKQWTLSTQITAATGKPQTPIFFATVPGTGFTNTIRPDLTGAPVRRSANGLYLNAGAFTAPAAGEWGDARRNSIEGPGQFSLDASLERSFNIRDPFHLDFGVDATNLLNHVTFTEWNTITNSTTFGLPAATDAMRSLQVSVRLRF